MRLLVIVCSFILTTGDVALAGSSSPSDSQDLTALAAEKQALVDGVHNPQVNVGGENIATATPILALPFSDTGDTCLFADDYDEVCPFGGSTAPDVVYSFAPSVDTALHIDLCQSDAYDTKVYVYENTESNPVACNDDACGINGWRSEIPVVNVSAGNTYYIVVDGFGGDCGIYQLEITETEPLPPCDSCEPGAIAEGEPVCTDNSVDLTNGGCNSVPPVYHDLPECAPRTVLCGTYGGFCVGDCTGTTFRDTDWYELTVTAADVPLAVTWSAIGETGTLVGILDGNAGCAASVFETSTTAPPCALATVNYTITTPGPWWFFVSPDQFGPEPWPTGAGPCGQNYNAILETSCPLPVESVTWGQLKTLYRD